MKDIKIGIIGFDTSHVVAFTKLLNDKNDPFHVEGGRIVAGYPSFSPDLYASYSRVESFKKELIEKYNIEIVNSIEELIKKVDAILLESVDGRRHLKEVEPVIKANKPVFIDKPLAANYYDALKIYMMAEEFQCPVFSCSSLRFDFNISKIKEDPELGEVYGCDAFSPCPIEPTNPGLFWYGIHGVEILYTFMGKGCEKVYCEATEDFHFVVGLWKNKIGTIRGIRKGVQNYGVTVFGEKKVYQTTYSTEVPLYSQLLKKIIEFFKTGKTPIDPEETLEIMKFIECALISEREKRVVKLEELK
ncbi:MAG: Gfo/Idh/MocA family oxidoreductase [Candidatus Omnitrophica bacterium]|nr:Gfo/Idh/MocA family oxidoreductase [Candidatus Omnitrophota bacterium]MCM8808920.1 Gfo/Idh/MocA family oxidoreductase [Candidatus Omnitrophota bacterium]MCM8810128.1 Gfo/Idh/MocA family oxidoreductase [Candidatus Omnitrophota bacterium]